MAEQKTLPTRKSVDSFLNEIEDEKRRNDCFYIAQIISQVTNTEPKMWGPSIVGFGSYHYKYESGHEGKAPLIGFSPRKQNLTLYLMLGNDQVGELLKKLGKFKTGKGCLYINKLEDIDLLILQEVIKTSFDYLNNKYN